MGSKDRIYGAIFCYVGGDSESNPRFALLCEQILAAVNKIPETDEYPRLTRNMFSITSSGYRTPGLYKEQVIHFGLTVKDISEDWAVWLEKFESLLEELPVGDAYLHLECEYPPDDREETVYKFVWSRPPGDFTNSLKFEGGPRSFSRAGKG